MRLQPKPQFGSRSRWHFGKPSLWLADSPQDAPHDCLTEGNIDTEHLNESWSPLFRKGTKQNRPRHRYEHAANRGMMPLLQDSFEELAGVPRFLPVQNPK